MPAPTWVRFLLAAFALGCLGAAVWILRIAIGIPSILLVVALLALAGVCVIAAARGNVPGFLWLLP